MLDLAGVTLCCIDTANHALALRAIERSRAAVRFARTLFVTDLTAGAGVPAGVDVVSIPPLGSRDDYSRFVLKSLLAHVGTPHVLLIQWDGYVVNPDAWDDAFLACDYIGAKWFWHDDGMRVGNGGFSLRSRRLLEALQDPRIDLVEAEDITIGRAFRPLLEREYGIRFATDELADRFAFEAAYPIGRPFGFHGLFNFCRIVPAGELARLASQFSDAIARSPQCVALARNCIALGDWQAAAALARRTLDAAPEHGEARALLALAEANGSRTRAVGRNDPCPCGSGRRYKQCHGAIAGAVTAAPARLPDAIAREAMDAHQRGELDAAERGYRDVLARVPAHPLATHYLGVILMQRRRLDEAVPLLERAARDVPHEPEFHNNLGLALAAADRPQQAIDAYRRALALKPDHAIASNNLGLALQALNRLPEAIAAFRSALLHSTELTQARWNLALALLANGDFAEGWSAYDTRLGLRELGALAPRDDAPRWDGVPRAGTTLLLSAEQGLGDAIQFARFVRPLAAAGMHVVLRVPQPLVRLLATVDGVAQSIGPNDPAPAHDAWLPLLSIAGALRVEANSIPADVPYLRPDSTRAATAARVVASRPGRVRAGIAWAGNPDHVNDRRRSIALAVLAPLFDVPAVAWFSLQKGDAGRELAATPAARHVVPLASDSTLDDTAALAQQLDVVVSVDTSIAHLAGALARPTWLMLPFAADWRWGIERVDSAWYPTMRLFRQPAIGDWAGVVRDVASALRMLVGEREGRAA
jgi:Flp pilus assembly protein TadD